MNINYLRVVSGNERNKIESNWVKKRKMVIDVIGDIDEFALPRLESNLSQYDGNDKELIVRIDTFGGYVDVAQAMCEKIIAFAEENEMTIVTENVGNVMSAGTLLYLLGDVRKFDKAKGEFLIHHVWCMNIGNAEQMYRCGDDLMSLDDYFLDFYEMATGVDRDEIKKVMDREETMGTDELTTLNFVTEFIN